jgi:hypothetical protein
VLGRRGALEHEDGGHDGRVVEDIGDVGQRRRRRAPARDVEPGPRPVADGVDDHRDPHDDPAQADPPDVDSQPGSEDERGREQVQGGFADVRDDPPRGVVAEARNEPADGDDPAKRREGDEEPVGAQAATVDAATVDTATAQAPVRHGSRGFRRPCPVRQASPVGRPCPVRQPCWPAGGQVAGADHGRCGDLETEALTGPRGRTHCLRPPIVRTGFNGPVTAIHPRDGHSRAPSSATGPGRARQR